MDTTTLLIVAVVWVLTLAKALVATDRDWSEFGEQLREATANLVFFGSLLGLVVGIFVLIHR